MEDAAHAEEGEALMQEGGVAKAVKEGTFNNVKE